MDFLRKLRHKPADVNLFIKVYRRTQNRRLIEKNIDRQLIIYDIL
jgi:hypothetical protein